MSREAIPAYDPDDMTHWYIWHAMAEMLTQEDFNAIQMALIEREDDLEAIEKSSIVYTPFDDDKVQPRRVDEKTKAKARKYADWACAKDICMILSKYAKFYSKL